MGLKSLAKLFNFVVCNPCQSSSSLTIHFPLWFIISLEFFHLCKTLFAGFVQFKGNFVDGQNISKDRDRAPLKCVCPLGSFLCKSNSFSYERFCTRTCFETEAQGNSGMAHFLETHRMWRLKSTVKKNITEVITK